jgi:hypothetical protein
MGELGSLAWPLILLAFLGAAIMLRGLSHSRYVSRTASPAYLSVPIQVQSFRLVPLKVDGSEIATDQSSARSMVLVTYGYRVDGAAYVSNAVFPMEIEWLKPRISALRLMDDLESGRLRNCHVDVKLPSKAVLFTGWSRHLRSHVLGVFGTGLLLVVLSAALWWSI